MRTLKVGWVVDAQEDFMRRSHGRLYVHNLSDPADPGAEQIIPKLVESVAWLEEASDVLVFSGDWHGDEDEEIDRVAPDPANGTYPAHCMGRSTDPDERAGAELIAEIRPKEMVVIAWDASSGEVWEAVRDAKRRRLPIFVHKTRFGFFEGAPYGETLMRALKEVFGADRIAFTVVGVATDVCVTQFIDGAVARGHGITAIRDVMYGLGIEEDAACWARWARNGRVVDFAAMAEAAK